MPSYEKIGTPGPFEVKLDAEIAPAFSSPHHAQLGETPRRRYECVNYDGCLELAAALNWDSFTCRGCNGEINDSLLWRARHSARKCSIARRICNLPPVKRFIRPVKVNEEQHIEGHPSDTSVTDFGSPNQQNAPTKAST